jgi:hypothetical protein
MARAMSSEPPLDATISAEPPTPPIAAPINTPFRIKSRFGWRPAAPSV